MQEPHFQANAFELLPLAIATTLLICTSSTQAQTNPSFHSSKAYASAAPNRTSNYTHDRLKEIELKQSLARENLRIAKEKERTAVLRLQQLQSSLKKTRSSLSANQDELKKTEDQLVKIQTNLETTNLQAQTVEQQAASRLREMFEGQRLGFIDSFFEISSLQQLIDFFYYQERVAELDKRLIDTIRTRATIISSQKTSLGQQKMQLSELVSTIARKAFMLNKEKTEHEQIAEKLRSQREFYEAAERQLARESEQLERQIPQMMDSNQKQIEKEIRHHSLSKMMMMPVSAPITSTYGWRRHPIFGIKKFHTGIDFAAPNHSPIRACGNGKVLYAGWYGGYGRVVIISHGGGVASLYAHMSKAAVATGDTVSMGDLVGYVGSTGFSTGPHLHFEIRLDGKPRNPLDYIK